MIVGPIRAAVAVSAIRSSSSAAGSRGRRELKLALIAATTRPVPSRSGRAIAAKPSSNSSTAKAQRLLGYGTMSDMMLTGRIFSAQDAERARLVQYVVPPGEALAKAKELAHRIAENTTTTNWMITNVLPRMNDLSHDDALFMEYLNTSMARHPDTIGRLKDFLEKKAVRLK